MSFDLQKFFNLSIDMLCIAGMDGYFKSINPSFERVLGWSAEELLSRPFLDFVHPDDLPDTLREIEKLAQGVPTISFRNRYRRIDGAYRQFRWTAYPEEETGLLYSVARDVTEIVTANERFQMGLEAAPGAMLIVNTEGRIEVANHQAGDLFGYESDELIGVRIEQLVPFRYRDQHKDHRGAYFEHPEARPMGQGRDLQALNKNGEEFPAEIGINPIEMNGAKLAIVSVIDLTYRREAEEKILKLAADLEEANRRLAEMASTDMLTGLNNRRAFDDQMRTLIGIAHRMKSSISLLLIDVDRFKNYNDRYGHPAGDEALKTLADLMKTYSRESDVLARYGGEELAVILPDTAEIGARAAGERLRAAIEIYPWPHETLTISIGVATTQFDTRVDTKDFDFGADLIRRADKALYHSKSEGRNRVSHFLDIPAAE